MFTTKGLSQLTNKINLRLDNCHVSVGLVTIDSYPLSRLYDLYSTNNSLIEFYCS